MKLNMKKDNLEFIAIIKIIQEILPKLCEMEKQKIINIVLTFPEICATIIKERTARRPRGVTSTITDTKNKSYLQ